MKAAADEAGAFVVKLYDQQDGQGVDRSLVAGALFGAAFDALDLVPDEAKNLLCRRVEIALYERMADHPGASNSLPSGPVSALSIIGVFKSMTPTPPK